MNDFYDRLDEIYGAGNLAAVEQFIIDAIGETLDGSVERAGLYNELAGFYRGVSRYEESEDAFSQALEIFDAAGMSATPEYATVLLNLAGLYRMRGEADNAVDLFLTAKKKLEYAEALESYAYVSILNNLALAYQEKGDYTLAFEYASAALGYLRESNGNEHEISASLNNLAAIELRQGNTDAADEYISEALAIYDAMPETDVHHAAALTTKSVILCRAGDYNGALNGFRQALELTRRFFGENIELASCKRNISDVCELLGDLQSAAAEQADAVRIMERILGPDHPSVQDARKKLERLNQM